MAKKLLWITILLLILVVLPVFSAEYGETISSSISAIEFGNYDKAASLANKALSIDPTDPSAHYAFGVIYLHTGRLNDAVREFTKAGANPLYDWRSQYALAAIELVRRKPNDALKRLNKISNNQFARSDVAALRKYLGSLGVAGKVSGVSGETDSPLVLETTAMYAAKTGNYSFAIEQFLDFLNTPAIPGFEEKRAPIVTFNPNYPIVLPMARLTWKPPAPLKLPVVAGTVTLKADARQVAGVSMITYYIDGNFAGITNYQPYEFQWNTRDITNGVHEIRMEGKDAVGSLISNKTIKVEVKNTQSKRPMSLEFARMLADRLHELVRVSESRKLAHYNLGKQLLKAGDRETACVHFEIAAAYDPDYLDTRVQIVSLRPRGVGFPQVWQARPTDRLIALTFDNSTNQKTTGLLEILRKVDVSATFFLVGSKAEIQPENVKEMVADGHEIETLLYSGSLPKSLSTRSAEMELCKGVAAIRSITGEQVLYYRTPDGNANPVILQAASRQGLTGVFRSIYCEPYETSSASKLAGYVIQKAAPGAIIEMHDGATVREALPSIVSELRSKGFQFVSITELMTSPQVSGVAPSQVKTH